METALEDLDRQLNEETAQVAYGIKAVQFKPTDPTPYAGQTRWLAARLTATGRASMWCRLENVISRANAQYEDLRRQVDDIEVDQ